jgi:hypothetical protein
MSCGSVFTQPRFNYARYDLVVKVDNVCDRLQTLATSRLLGAKPRCQKQDLEQNTGLPRVPNWNTQGQCSNMSTEKIFAGADSCVPAVVSTPPVDR